VNAAKTRNSSGAFGGGSIHDTSGVASPFDSEMRVECGQVELAGTEQEEVQLRHKSRLAQTTRRLELKHEQQSSLLPKGTVKLFKDLKDAQKLLAKERVRMNEDLMQDVAVSKKRYERFIQ